MIEAPELLVITNAIYPYHLHNVAILSLPFRATYHFRYEQEYFDVNGPLLGLKGKIGLLVLRDRERATFVPLRLFRVLDVDDCNELVFLDLQFLNFVAYDASRSEFQGGAAPVAVLSKERERYSHLIETQVAYVHSQKNEPNGHLNKLILSVNPQELSVIGIAEGSQGPSFADAWSRVVNVLGGMAVYERVCFYLLAAIVDVRTNRHAGVFTKGLQAGLVMETRRVYLLRIYQLMGNRVPPPRPGFSLRVDGMEPHLAVLRSERRIDGAYDRLSFLLSVLPQEDERSASSLVLSCDQTIPDPSDPQQSSSIPPSILDLQIQWPLWDRFMKWFGYPVLFVFGVGLFLKADDVQKHVGLGGGDIGKYLVQLFGLSLLAMGGKNWSFLTGAFRSGPPGTRT